MKRQQCCRIVRKLSDEKNSTISYTDGDITALYTSRIHIHLHVSTNTFSYSFHKHMHMNISVHTPLLPLALIYTHTHADLTLYETLPFCNCTSSDKKIVTEGGEARNLSSIQSKWGVKMGVFSSGSSYQSRGRWERESDERHKGS